MLALAVVPNLGAMTISTEHFVIEHSQEDSAYARIAAQHLEEKIKEMCQDFDLACSDTFFVTIVPSRRDFRKYLNEGLPNWTGAFATPALRSMVVRSPRWARDNRSFKVTLTHELLHLVLPDIVNNKRLPRWLDEGMAIFYSGEEHWQTSTALSKALATDSYIPLKDIDSVLRFHRVPAELAYQESFAALHYLLSVYDLDGLKTILFGLRDGQSLDQVFLQATGSTFSQFEQEWLAHEKKKQKWYWLSEFESYLWLLILILLGFATLAIRLRNRRIKQSWELSEEETE